MTNPSPITPYIALSLTPTAPPAKTAHTTIQPCCFDRCQRRRATTAIVRNTATVRSV